MPRCRRLRHAATERPVVMCELATASEESALDVVADSLTIDGRPGVPTADRLAGVLAEVSTPRGDVRVRSGLGNVEAGTPVP